MLHAAETHLIHILGELNGLIQEKGTSTIGELIEATKEQARPFHSNSVFTEIKTFRSVILADLLFSGLLYFLLVYTNLLSKVCIASQQARHRFNRPPTKNNETFYRIYFDATLEKVELETLRSLTAPTAERWSPLAPENHETTSIYPRLPETTDVGTIPGQQKLTEQR